MAKSAPRKSQRIVGLINQHHRPHGPMRTRNERPDKAMKMHENKAKCVRCTPCTDLDKPSATR
jgi:hypothetical protein